MRRSNDPAQLSSIERRYYVAPTTRPGDSITYGDWRDTDEVHTWYDRTRESPGNCLGRYEARGIPLTVIEYATGSDYSGSLVEVSNMRTLKAEFPWLVELHGGYGTRGLAYLGKRENQNPRLIEAIDSLCDYSIYDEDDHSALEWELTAEAWEDDGRDDFKCALAKYFDLILDEEHAHDLDDENHNAAVDALWSDLVEIYRGGEDHLNEQGDSIYFPVYQIFEQISDPRFGDYLDKGPYSGERGTIREQFDTLCDASRVKEDESV